jgi:hypothetical protein
MFWLKFKHKELLEVGLMEPFKNIHALVTFMHAKKNHMCGQYKLVNKRT